MASVKVKRPFKHPFLSGFTLTPAALPFTDREIVSFDRELSEYEQMFLDPDIERTLISKNELMASFAISKAENSQLTLKEAGDVYDLILDDADYDFVREKLKSKKKPAQKDHDRLEFFNIAKTFRGLGQSPISIDELTPEKICDLHRQLTQGLDIFQDFLAEFTTYKSGKFRDNNNIRVGEYVPAPYTGIKSGLEELISWLKDQRTATGVAVFHTALYGLHPFNNGNKRVCRILEHALLRGLGLNGKNLYSSSYYYHKQKQRYYKYLLYSLLRKNLNHFAAFILEAVVLSMASVVKTGLEIKRSEFLARAAEKPVRAALRPLVKRREVQFKNLVRYNKAKMARQTLVTYLSKAAEQGFLNKRVSGRTTYYRLNLTAPEEATLARWIKLAEAKLGYIPDEIRLI